MDACKRGKQWNVNRPAYDTWFRREASQMASVTNIQFGLIITFLVDITLDTGHLTDLEQRCRWHWLVLQLLYTVRAQCLSNFPPAALPLIGSVISVYTSKHPCNMTFWSKCKHTTESQSVYGAIIEDFNFSVVPSFSLTFKFLSKHENTHTHTQREGEREKGVKPILGQRWTSETPSNCSTFF